MRGHALGIRRTNGSPMRHQLSVLSVLIAGVLVATLAATAAGADTTSASPARGGAAQPVSRATQPAPVAVHWVRPGDTLLGIASRYSGTVAMIKQAYRLWTAPTLPG